MNAQVIEGTSEEIATLLQSGALEGRRLRVIIDPDEDDFLVPDTALTIGDPVHLETLLLEGLNSGPATPMTSADWDDIRQEVRARANRRAEQRSADA